MRAKRIPIYTYPALIYFIFFLICPILILLLYAISVGTGMSLDLSRITLANFSRLFSISVYKKVIGTTVIIALETTLISLAISYFPALYLARTTSRYKPGFFLLFLIPFWTPYVVRIFSWTTVLLREGVLNQLLAGLKLIPEPMSFLFSRGAVLLVLVYSSVPFMVLPIATSISSIRNSCIEAARNLGATQFEAFRHIILPLSVPGVWAGSVLTFTITVGSFVGPSIVGGPSDQMIAQLIVDRFLWLGHWPSGAAISIIFVMAILVTVYLASRVVPLERIFRV